MHLPRLLALAAVAALAIGAVVFVRSRTGERARALAERSEAAVLLAKHLAEHHAGARVLVVGNPFTQLAASPDRVRASEASVLRGLREGFDGRVNLVAVAYPELKPGAAEDPHRFAMPAGATTPLSYLVADDAFARLAGEYDVDLLVSLIGIPVNLARQPGWDKPDGPALAFFLPDLWMLGRPADIARAFGSGRLAAAVVPAAPTPEAPAGYRVLTPDNIRANLSAR